MVRDTPEGMPEGMGTYRRETTSGCTDFMEADHRKAGSFDELPQNISNDIIGGHEET